EKRPGTVGPPGPHTDKDLNPNQNPTQAPDENSGRNTGTNTAEKTAPTPTPHQPTQEQKEEDDHAQDHHPGEGGYSDRSTPAGGVGVIPAGDRGGDNIGPDTPDGGRGSGGGRRKGCLLWLLPLIMGAIGALAVLLLFNFFGNEEETGIQEAGQTAVESDQESVPEDSRNELDDIKQQIEENSGNSAEGITDTT